jgi:hypothetical protein
VTFEGLDQVLDRMIILESIPNFVFSDLKTALKFH